MHIQHAWVEPLSGLGKTHYRAKSRDSEKLQPKYLASSSYIYNPGQNTDINNYHGFLSTNLFVSTRFYSFSHSPYDLRQVWRLSEQHVYTALRHNNQNYIESIIIIIIFIIIINSSSYRKLAMTNIDKQSLTNHSTQYSFVVHVHMPSASTSH